MKYNSDIQSLRFGDIQFKIAKSSKYVEFMQKRLDADMRLGDI